MNRDAAEKLILYDKKLGAPAQVRYSEKSQKYIIQSAKGTRRYMSTDEITQYELSQTICSNIEENTIVFI